eukprot:2714916-Amphidinium_carterae.1
MSANTSKSSTAMYYSFTTGARRDALAHNGLRHNRTNKVCCLETRRRDPSNQASYRDYKRAATINGSVHTKVLQTMSQRLETKTTREG